MLLTEEQAREKWCPFTSAALSESDYSGNAQVHKGAPSFNRFHDANRDLVTNPPSCRCIGSHCMAWQSLPPAPVFDESANVTEMVKHGYCGAFGEPK